MSQSAERSFTHFFAQLGHVVLRYPTWILGFWVLVMVVSLSLTPTLEQSLRGAGMTYEGSAARQTEQKLQQEIGFAIDPLTIVFQATNRPLDTREIESLLDRVQNTDGVSSVTRTAVHPEFRSADGRTQYNLVNLAATNTPAVVIDRIEANFERDIPADMQIFVTGRAVVDRDAQRISKVDLGRAELVALPLTLIALLFVFGSWVAASLPIVMGIFSVSVTLGCLYLIAQQMQMSVLAINFASMLGLGLGIDYSLLIVNRFREERQHRSKQQAIIHTVGTAGQAVFVSGITVCISLACLMLFPISLLRSISIAGSIVVLLSVTAALTVLPALLSLLDRQLNWRDRQSPTQSGQQNFWRWIAHHVTRHSVLSLLGVLGIIGLLSAPFLQAELGLGDASVLPKTVSARAGVEVIQTAFGAGETAPILLAINTPNAGERILSPSAIERLYNLIQKLQSDPRVLRVSSLFNLPLPPGLPPGSPLAQYKQLYASGTPQPPPIAAAIKSLSSETTTLMAITSRTDSHSPESHQLVQELRQMDLGGLKSQVGGQTAIEIDTIAAVLHQFPIILSATMVITFGVLCLLFESVILPLKAIVMNFMSIGASFGALVFVFQQGHLSQWLNFQPLGYLDILLPLVLFGVVFGLSMDYEVFLLTRIKEIYDECGDNSRSVIEGLEHTGSIITSAAALMIIVTGAFALTSIIFMKALGLGIALAILIDATLIRVILVPSTMHLMGKWNWWRPSWGRILPTKKVDRP
jgi:putative drug exporter of the RND superfamily